LLCTLLVVLINGRLFAQQRVQFTQYMFNGLVLNPAYAGGDEVLSLTLLSRSQWAKVEGAPSTQTLSAHTLLPDKNLGLGVTIINDKIGVHKDLNAVVSSAYHLKVGRQTSLSMGIQAGINSRKSDYPSLLGNAGNDPKLSDVTVSQTFLDLGAGFYLRSPRLHVGLSAPRILPARLTVNDTVAFDLNNIQYFLLTRYRISLNQNLALEPGFLLKYLPGVPLSFDINASLIIYEVLTTGFSYRKNESVDFLLKAQITPRLQLGYAYDHTIGDVRGISPGSNELMVSYQFKPVHQKIVSPR